MHTHHAFTRRAAAGSRIIAPAASRAPGRGSARSAPVRCSTEGSAAQRPLVVVGSVNVDIVMEVERMPKRGETMAANGFNIFPGGKGANQAAAAARLGYPTQFVGQVGDDGNAALLRQALQNSGVGIEHLRTVAGPTGTAVVLLKPSGDNSIIIGGGANTAEWEFRDDTKELLRQAGTLLLQREIPDSVSLQAARLAREGGARVVMDCGGAEGPIDDELLSLVTLLSPNETELARLTGKRTSSEASVDKAASLLMEEHGVPAVLVKLGEKGSRWIRREGFTVFSTGTIAAGEVVDTTAAGDCYTAALVVALQEGRHIGDAMHFAAAAAGICVTRRGALPSLPSREEVDALLAQSSGAHRLQNGV